MTSIDELIAKALHEDFGFVGTLGADGRAIYADCQQKVLRNPDGPEFAQALQSLDGQITNLAEFIVHNVPGEPSADEGAVDTAIRIIQSLQREVESKSAIIAEVRAKAILAADMDPVNNHWFQRLADEIDLTQSKDTVK